MSTVLAGRLRLGSRTFAVEEVPVPVPGPGEVLARRPAAGGLLMLDALAPGGRRPRRHDTETGDDAAPGRVHEGLHSADARHEPATR